MASTFLLSFILDNMEEFHVHIYAVWTQKKKNHVLYMTNANLTVKKKCRPGVHKYGAAVCSGVWYGICCMSAFWHLEFWGVL
jgi:hypothetical protein